MIRIGCPVETRTPTRTPGGDILTLPWTQDIGMVFKLGGKIWTDARIFAQKNTMHTRTPITDTRRVMATKISTRNNIARDSCAATEMRLTGGRRRFLQRETSATIVNLRGRPTLPVTSNR